MDDDVAEAADAALFDEILVQENLGHRPTGPVAEVVAPFARRARIVVDSAAPHLRNWPGVYVSFVGNPTFNAWATRHCGRYFIGIHVSVPDLLLAIAYRLLADPLTFPEVGNPGEETAELPRYTITPDIRKSVLVPIAPRNLQRREYALHLCTTVFDFIASHELTHIAHGHVGYRANCGNPFISELAWQAGTAGGNVEAQAMEMDADFKAAELAALNVRRLLSIRDELPPGSGMLYRDPAQAMFLVAAAMCIQARLFGDARLSFTDLVTTDHPPDRWRQLMVLNVMGNEADRFWGSAVSDQVIASINRAIAEVEESFERMTGGPQQVHGLHDVWHGPGWEYCRALCYRWNDEVKPKASPHAFTDLRTYSFDWPQS